MRENYKHERKKEANFLDWRRREVGGVPKHPRQIFNRGHGGTLIIIYIYM